MSAEGCVSYTALPARPLLRALRSATPISMIADGGRPSRPGKLIVRIVRNSSAPFCNEKLSCTSWKTFIESASSRSASSGAWYMDMKSSKLEGAAADIRPKASPVENAAVRSTVSDGCTDLPVLSNRRSKGSAAKAFTSLTATFASTGPSRLPCSFFLGKPTARSIFWIELLILLKSLAPQMSLRSCFRKVGFLMRGPLGGS
mmetsp:Transcript_88404/g.270576  ORF Transcript_88404/g.270576 Transcript_88404/m.270576 type:complete len:202 (+) Transcript_88404:1061-1666(+)